MAACVTAVSLYALLRGAQLLLFREPNPATVIWSAHAGYFWRTPLIVSYSGGMGGIIAWLVAGREPERVARVLASGVIVAAAILVQGLLLP